MISGTPSTPITAAGGVAPFGSGGRSGTGTLGNCESDCSVEHRQGPRRAPRPARRATAPPAAAAVTPGTGPAGGVPAAGQAQAQAWHPAAARPPAAG